MFLIKPLKENVMDPATSTDLVKDGIKVEAISTYWFRRGRDHDVKITQLDAPAAVAPEISTKKKGV